MKVLLYGAGSVGSFTAYGLMTVENMNLTVIDKDVVEEHNQKNQLYGTDFVGLPKTESLGEELFNRFGNEIATANEDPKVLSTKYWDYIIIAVDNVHARKRIRNSILTDTVGIPIIEAFTSPSSSLMVVSMSNKVNAFVNDKYESIIQLLEANGGEIPQELNSCGGRNFDTTQTMMVSGLISQYVKLNKAPKGVQRFHIEGCEVTEVTKEV